jgi:hypothetical protein
MRFIEGTLGGVPGKVFLHDSTLRQTVDLGSPATRVKALLRGFRIGHSGSDHHFKNLSIDLNAGYANDPSQVEVTARVRMSDSSPTTDGLSIGPELIDIRVDFTLLVE